MEATKHALTAGRWQKIIAVKALQSLMSMVKTCKRKAVKFKFKIKAT